MIPIWTPNRLHNGLMKQPLLLFSSIPLFHENKDDHQMLINLNSINFIKILPPGFYRTKSTHGMPLYPICLRTPLKHNRPRNPWPNKHPASRFHHIKGIWTVSKFTSAFIAWESALFGGVAIPDCAPHRMAPPSPDPHWPCPWAAVFRPGHSYFDQNKFLYFSTQINIRKC